MKDALNALTVLNAFSTVFQTDETKIGALLPEMDRLLRKLLVQFIQMKHVKGVDLQQIAFSDRELQQDQETIAVRMAARPYLHDEDLVPPRIRWQFFTDMRSFYAAAVGKMVQKFPFKDPILPDSVVLDLSKKNDLVYAPIVRLADRFAPHVDAELLKEEWNDFKLLDEGAVSMVDAKGKQQTLDKVWSEIST